MKRGLEASRYPALLAVVSLVAAAAGAFVWGTISAVQALVHSVEHAGSPPLFSVELVALMDRFLLASAPLLFAIGLYELFIGGLTVPAWLEIRNLHDLDGGHLPRASDRMEQPAGPALLRRRHGGRLRGSDRLRTVWGEGVTLPLVWDVTSGPASHAGGHERA